MLLWQGTAAFRAVYWKGNARKRGGRALLCVSQLELLQDCESGFTAQPWLLRPFFFQIFDRLLQILVQGQGVRDQRRGVNFAFFNQL